MRSAEYGIGSNFSVPDPISGHKIAVPDESELLINFADFIQTFDPDIIIGWDIIGSSIGYILTRVTTGYCLLGHQR